MKKTPEIVKLARKWFQEGYASERDDAMGGGWGVDHSGHIQAARILLKEVGCVNEEINLCQKEELHKFNKHSRIKV